MLLSRTGQIERIVLPMALKVGLTIDLSHRLTDLLEVADLSHGFAGLPQRYTVKDM